MHPNHQQNSFRMALLRITGIAGNDGFEDQLSNESHASDREFRVGCLYFGGIARILDVEARNAEAGNLALARPVRELVHLAAKNDAACNAWPARVECPVLACTMRERNQFCRHAMSGV